MDKAYIEISIATLDHKGNLLSSTDRRVMERHEIQNSKDDNVFPLETYFKIFTQTLVKQEYNYEAILKGFNKFFIDMDKGDIQNPGSSKSVSKS